MSNVFAGTAHITVDGNPMPVRANVTVNSAKFTRAGVPGLDGPHGFTETAVMPSIEFDISMKEGISAEQIQALEDTTVQAEDRSGRVYVLINASKVGPAEHNLVEGTMRVRFEGMDVQEFA